MNATMSLDQKKHHSVMLKEILSIISPQHGGTYIDCTFGGGGLSREILKYPGTRVVAFDRDNLVKKYANVLEKKFPKRFKFFQTKFSDIGNKVDLKLKPKAIIFDLGLSSLQLSDEMRGFSFKSKTSLSMEMGINKYNAYDVINNFDKENLTKIIKIYGEEKDGKKIANHIIHYRKKRPIKTSEELSSIVEIAKRNNKNFKKNPATKTFQAIRIFVNQELTELVNSLIEATKLLKKGGVLIVISFHSLEDKIVKYFFKIYSNLRNNPSRYLPLKNESPFLFDLLSKKPLVPNQSEINKNIRSRSAKLRFAKRNNSLFFYPEEFKKKFINFFKIEEIEL